MYAVEVAMRAMAERSGGDPDEWGWWADARLDYERYPNATHSLIEEHLAEGDARGLGLPEASQRAIWGTPTLGFPRQRHGQGAFAVDELCGFLVACALVRPSRSLQDLEVSSVKKKLKDKAFARGVSRDDVIQGAAEIGVPLDEHIAFVLGALRPHERALGLGSA
jgi:predicted hydrolase (HD superfamily)